MWRKVHGSPISKVKVSTSQRWGDSKRPVWQGKSTEKKTWRSKVIGTFPDGTLTPFRSPRDQERTPTTCVTNLPPLSVCCPCEGTCGSHHALSRTGVESGGVTSERPHLIAVILPAFRLPFNAQRPPRSASAGWSSYKYPERPTGLSSPLHPLNGFQSFSPCCIVSQSLFPPSFPSLLS